MFCNEVIILINFYCFLLNIIIISKISNHKSNFLNYLHNILIFQNMGSTHLLRCMFSTCTPYQRIFDALSHFSVNGLTEVNDCALLSAKNYRFFEIWYLSFWFSVYSNEVKVFPGDP